jgi:hypothetical protein
MSRHGLLAGILAAGLAFVPSKPAVTRPKADPEAKTLDLCLDVQALRAVYLLRLNEEQVKKLQAIAKDLAAPDREREKPRASEEYRRVLANLRDALAADDEEKVSELEDRLSELTDSEAPELDDAVQVSAAARKRAPEVMRLLRPYQLAGYLGSISEEIGDPQQRLVDALAQVRSDKEENWEETRDDLARDLGGLLGGLDAARSKQLREQVSALLTRAHGLNEPDFDKQRAALEKEARRIGDVGPTEVVRHAAERGLARLLSNPRLVPVLEARRKASSP